MHLCMGTLHKTNPEVIMRGKRRGQRETSTEYRKPTFFKMRSGDFMQLATAHPLNPKGHSGGEMQVSLSRGRECENPTDGLTCGSMTKIV